MSSNTVVAINHTGKCSFTVVQLKEGCEVSLLKNSKSKKNSTNVYIFYFQPQKAWFSCESCIQNAVWLFFCVQLCFLCLRLLRWLPLGFVWPSTRLQQDLMTFIIRWRNLIWAALVSEMSIPIWSHAGENKRASNYSSGARVWWVQFVGDESNLGQDTEKKQERRIWWVMKEIYATVKYWEFQWGFASSPRRYDGPSYHPQPPSCLSKQLSIAGELEDLFTTMWDCRPQISNVSLGIYSVAGLLQPNRQTCLFSCQTLTWSDCLISRKDLRLFRKKRNVYKCYSCFSVRFLHKRYGSLCVCVYGVIIKNRLNTWTCMKWSKHF